MSCSDGDVMGVSGVLNCCHCEAPHPVRTWQRSVMYITEPKWDMNTSYIHVLNMKKYNVDCHTIYTIFNIVEYGITLLQLEMYSLDFS